ncbi:MAG TPA: excinuclease ABC subunit UvrA [Oligoflexia bacterium]|nr:excinuclease ABC subunit UvrA [Oligoflexia bacterium]HMP48296.1 excinuclease ABC subunit UvrA [Oligoflexia bacterium]
MNKKKKNNLSLKSQLPIPTKALLNSESILSIKESPVSKSPNFSFLNIENLRENNLKGVSVSIPHDKISVVCGPSGSGKSTLAFDTVYAEGGRRYIETFNPYTRQFLDRLKEPDADRISNVRPALALEQRNRVTSSRSTVGTVTEINDYLKILWAGYSELFCPECNIPVLRFTPQVIINDLEKRRETDHEFVLVTFETPLTGQGSRESLVQALQGQGFQRFLRVSESKKLAPQIKRIEELDEGDLDCENIFIVVDRIRIENDSKSDFSELVRERLISSLTEAYSYSAYSFAGPELQIWLVGENKEHKRLNYKDSLSCTGCGKKFQPASPPLFSFNSPIGACDKCQGFGKVLEIDPSKCVPDENLSMREGAIACWEGPAASRERSLLFSFCEQNEISLDVPWRKLAKHFKSLIINGPDMDPSGKKPKRITKDFVGILPWFKYLGGKRHKMHVRVFIARYRSEILCSSCNGTRLVSDAANYRINGLSIKDFWNLPIDKSYDFISSLNVSKESEFVWKEIYSRLNYLIKVGLPYLSLDRQTRTLSGGEFQRVNLTNILGSNLVQTTLVLDEPTIGLHPRDTGNLIRAMGDLKDRGNTLVVVEHDPDVIKSADNIIEIGPGSGSQGGEIVFEGTFNKILDVDTRTGRYLKSPENFNNLETGKNETGEKARSGGKKRFVRIQRARANNLKNIDVSIPINHFSVITGVSGSGKSTLMLDCFNAPVSQIGMADPLIHPDSTISGLSAFSEVVLIDQQPIGRSSRANPATYTKAWDIFREYLAETEGGVALGLGKSSFSFNVDGGRCPVCSGNGSIKVEMQFLNDVFVECESCSGRRFQDQILTVQLGGKNVFEWLNSSISTVISDIGQLPDVKKNEKIKKALNPLVDLGLGYLPLGHSLSALSGGEAQRLKLASFLVEVAKAPKFIILDEPTTGLHPSDILLLLKVFYELIKKGHTVLCIEHNLDVIRASDWIIELGPEGGDKGGEVLLEGETGDIIKDLSLKSPTLSYLRSSILDLNKNRRTKDLNLEDVKEKAGDSDLIDENSIKIIGAREHNLKNISISIPKNVLSVITGVSGSGKSTLAFDILFSEGQRRFLDCLSPYARQYIKSGSRPDVDQVLGVPPTIAVSQKTSPPPGISTLGTVSEVYQYLRLLFSKAGTQYCVKERCIGKSAPVSNFSSDRLREEILKRYNGKKIYIFSPVVSGRKGHYSELFVRALKGEISEARIDGVFRSFNEETRLERHKLHWISLLTGRLTVSEKSSDLIEYALSQALVLSGGSVEISVIDPNQDPEVFSTSRVCPTCKTGYMPLDPQDFSFRSLRGMCDTCGGRGFVTGATERSQKKCPSCNGARIGKIGRNVRIFDKTIYDLCLMTAPQLIKFFEKSSFDNRLSSVVTPLLSELKGLLSLIDQIGLGYLVLDRDASTLSGGEAQRLRLAKNLGSPLTGVCYILDEPSIGLHSQDHAQLMSTLRAMRDQGNTVIVVEHDEDTIREADHVIDIGPKGGAEGGYVVHTGGIQELISNSESLTGYALRERSNPELSNSAKKWTEHISLTGAFANNLKGIDVQIPLGALTVVAGVSGAGKSSLVHGSLYPAVYEEFEGRKEREKFFDQTWKSLSISSSLSRMIEIDQNPIGKTSASTPASFLGVFNFIRDIFSSLPEAKIRGYSPSYFSYNRGDGRCSACEGRGVITIPMSFLPDATTLCESCMGLRYKEEALQVRLSGLSIGDVLKKTIDEAYEIFNAYPRVKRCFEYARQLGIGYISLGQPSYTLSGGEAQRLKISRELGLTESSDTLYILDEPTIGLHMIDVDKLIKVLRRLVSMNNSVVVIEHNLDVLLSADYVIELGPEAGDKGGELLFQGPVSDFLSLKKKTPTVEQVRKYLARFS